jgi:bifunctional DNA-binding transcriptional regulator/antitoxin component of YhaV-PrlF toxin-antitoxin module
MIKMAEIVLMDKSGRVIIPGRIRKKYQTRKFVLQANENMIQLIPVKPLESLFGTIPELDLSRVYKEHEEEKDEE